MPKFSKLFGKLTGKLGQVNFGKPTFYNSLVSLRIQPIFLVNFSKTEQWFTPYPYRGSKL